MNTLADVLIIWGLTSFVVTPLALWAIKHARPHHRRGWRS